MRNLTTKSKQEFITRTSLWDAFISYLENIYFPGAAESLDTKLIAFEYENFVSTYS